MPSYTERVILSKPNDFNNIPNNAGSGGVVSSNVTETINNVTVNGSNISIFNQEFLDTTSAILTWTQNNNKLPTTNILPKRSEISRFTIYHYSTKHNYNR
jgi:hypothetical protein